jgi:serine/threonine-protein kinase
MALPQRIGKYEVRSRIGHGGMGVVYRAHDPDLDRDVAIKVIGGFDPHSPNYEEILARFRRESRAVAMLSHPNVVNVFDLGRAAESEGGAPYLVMELVDGESLEQVVLELNDSRAAPTTHESTLRILKQIAQALDYAHSSGIVHRDVKPANVLMRRDGVAKLTDFGIARIMNDRVTRTGLMLGTPAYMSPEQIRGEHVDFRSDQFSFAVVAWQMLSEGSLPFSGDTDFALMQEITAGSPAPLKAKSGSANGQGYPPAVEQALRRALSKRPDDRFPTCGEFFTALEISFQRRDAPAARIAATVLEDAPPVAIRPETVRMTPVPPPARPVADAANPAVPISKATSGSNSRFGLKTIGIALIGIAAAVLILIAVTKFGFPPPGRDASSGQVAAPAARDTPAVPKTAASGTGSAPSPTEQTPDLTRADTATRMKAAKVFFDHKDFAAAEGIYRQIVGSEPRNVDALKALAATLAKEDKINESAAILATLPKTVEPANGIAVAPGPGEAERPPAKGDSRVNPKDGLTYLWIPPGKFDMGCSPGDAECYDDEKPQQPGVQVLGFWLGKTDVTQAAWNKVGIAANPSHFKGDDLPVESVDWNQATAYCKAIGGRLPSEKEWEYAARAGTPGPRYGAINEIAWYDGNSGHTTHPVGTKLPNAFGLYDMLGNVDQWTSSDWAPYPGGTADKCDGCKVLRGGSWNGSITGVVRASFRNGDVPTYRYYNIGFRCVGEFR